MFLCLPIVDEGWDEVDSRLVCNDKAFFQTSTHAQIIGSKLLKIRPCFFIKAYIDLVKAFHIVHIHTHHVTQSVGHEQRMCTSTHGLFSVAFGQAEFFQAVKHQTAYVEMHVGILHTGLSHV